MAKRPSGAQQRARRKQGVPLGTPGCPKGTVTEKVAKLRLQLFKDLVHNVWIDPYWRDDKEISSYRLVEILRKKWPNRYKHLSPRTLRRHVDFIRANTEGGAILWPGKFIPPGGTKRSNRGETC